jgi:hypothetical protein
MLLECHRERGARQLGFVGAGVGAGAWAAFAT